MGNIRKKERIQKIVFENWLDKLSDGEVEQEELIQIWQNPDLEGYQGLLSYNEFLYRYYKDSKLSLKTVPLKKNTPAKDAGVFISSKSIADVINKFDITLRGKISIIIQPVIEEYFYGNKINSIRQLSKKLNIGKSHLHRLIKEIRSQASRSSSSSSSE